MGIEFEVRPLGLSATSWDGFAARIPPVNTCTAAQPLPTSARVQGWAPAAQPRLREAQPLNYKRLELPFHPGDGWEAFDGTISCRRDRIGKKNKTLTSSLNYGGDSLAIGQGLFCWEAWAIPIPGIAQGQQQQSPGILIFHPSDRAMGN